LTLARMTALVSLTDVALRVVTAGVAALAAGAAMAASASAAGTAIARCRM